MSGRVQVDNHHVHRRNLVLGHGRHMLGIAAHVQDAAMQESMGAIVDRTREHLSASDAAIIRMRKCIMQAARELAEQETTPPGIADPALYRAHGDQFLVTGTDSWKDTYQRQMRDQYATVLE